MIPTGFLSATKLNMNKKYVSYAEQLLHRIFVKINGHSDLSAVEVAKKDKK